MISSVWKKAALIGVIWGIVNALTLILPPVLFIGNIGFPGPVISLLSQIIGVPLTLLVGYFGAKSYAKNLAIEMTPGIVAGLVSGLIFAIVNGIVSKILFVILALAGAPVYGVVIDFNAEPTRLLFAIFGLLFAEIFLLPLGLAAGAFLGCFGGAAYAKQVIKI